MKLKQPNSRHCFACGLENPIGLKLKFYQTAEDEVTADYVAPEEYQGYPGILHGGVTATILDEAVGRDDGEGGGLDRRRVVAEADHHPRRRGHPRLDVPQEGLLAELTERCREGRGQREALRIVVWQVT